MGREGLTGTPRAGCKCESFVGSTTLAVKDCVGEEKCASGPWLILLRATAGGGLTRFSSSVRLAACHHDGSYVTGVKLASIDGTGISSSERLSPPSLWCMSSASPLMDWVSWYT